MNVPPTTPRALDTFESALLTELRQHVAAHPVHETAPAPAPHRRRRGRLAVGLAVAAAAATAFVVASPGGPGTCPAYAVDQDADGDVVVTIHRLEDSAGLEAALRDHGIDAEVSFQPTDAGDLGITNYVDSEGNVGEGPPPAEGGVTDEQEEGGGGPGLEASGGAVQQAKPAEDGQVPDLPDCGLDGADPASLSREGDEWVLRIPADSPLQDRAVQITTGEGGDLMVSYPGNTPGSYCGVATVG